MCVSNSGKTKRRVRGKLALDWLKLCLNTVAVFNKHVKCRDRCTLKTYRAGRAIAMAAQGETLAQIQLAGEWSSTSEPFSYMNTDIADKSQELKRIVEAELQDDPVDDLEEEGESESDKDGIQEVLPAPPSESTRLPGVE